MGELKGNLHTLLEHWLKYDKNPISRAEIVELWEEKKFDELERRLRYRIAFGTAGLRGRMAPGFSCMNEVTVMQASQGLARWFKSEHADICSLGVVLGHDARHNSDRFAELAVNAFQALDIPVYFFTELSATPLVSYSIKHYKTAGGVMVTASHNPALDNGYKVYFQRSAQINSPMDQEISEFIEKNLDPWVSAWNQPSTYEMDKQDPLRSSSYHPVVRAYKESIRQFALSTVDRLEQPSPFVYTPLHGVGGLFMPQIMGHLGIGERMSSVPLQSKPDPDFPTVKFPNPEEVGALDLAMELGDKEHRDIIIANDPDADRFAAAQKINGDKWFTFTGNQLGVLLASHLIERRSELKQNGRCIVLASTVSTGMLRKIASAHGISFEETLTGFKWMGNRAFELADEGWEVLFSFEEALGYMFPNICNDKDGLTAAAVFMVAEGKWRSQGITPYEKLQQLYQTYGYHETLNTYFRSPSPVATAALFNGIRGGRYRKGEKLGAFEILRLRDMTEGYDSDTADNKPALPVDRASHMLTLWLDRGVVFTLRGSGTEPKVKIYIESCRSSQSDAISAVCHTFETVEREWISRFGGEMTSLPHIVTSSGHIYGQQT